MKEQSELNWEAIQSADDEAFGELSLPRHADIWQALEQNAEQHLQLQTRKRCAEAVMGAETKRQQGIVLSGQNQLVGLFEAGGVAIPRNVE